jgi:tRNA-uridine 2-sulfurtransferase
MRIFVGLSGGVDSAVSAALLQKQGHDVVGAYIKIWSPEFTECTWREDRLDAKRVAVHLGIPFLEIDLSEVYLKEVVQDMIDNYSKGITPNPDVLCNRSIKFGAFAKWAFEKGADKIATGHYARIGFDGNTYTLSQGVDRAKDQSYFLYRLSQSDLARTLFPVGDLPKSEVRTKAIEFGLPVARKADSQGLCFVGDITMKDFLARFITLQKGIVTDTHGRAIGEHDGAALYTIGQRHGLSLFPGVESGPYYVTHIDTNNNQIRVSRNAQDCLSREARLRDITWIHTEPELPLKTTAATRYHATPCSVVVSREDDTFRVRSEVPQLFSPGQSLVLFAEDACIGGAIIA